MSTTSDQTVKDSLQQLFEARLQRRQALKIIGGTAAVTTLAACGVTPAPTLQPQVPLRTNQVMLRARVNNLTGRDRDRLRAIATYVNPGNRSRVSITGEYWTVDKPIVAGRPGAAFLGHGLDIVVFVRGETAAAVQEWASQWPGILEVQSDSFEPVDLPADQGAVAADMPTFLVFERLSGEASELRPIFGQLPAGVTVVSHNRLTSDQNRQVLVVRAASRQLVREWVGQWVGFPNSMEILTISNLSEQLLRPAQPSSTLPALALAQSEGAPDIELDGRLVVGDLRPGQWLYRHQATNRFLAVRTVTVDGVTYETLTTVVEATEGDQWETIRVEGVGENVSGSYCLRHTGSGNYLTYDDTNRYRPWELILSGFRQGRNSVWAIPLVGVQNLGAMDKNGRMEYYLTADRSGKVDLEPQKGDWSFHPTGIWAQTTYIPLKPLQQKLKDIYPGTIYDAPWPEDTWRDDPSPEGQARWKAYTDLLGKLNGKRPNDWNNTFSDTEIEDALAKVPGYPLALPPEYRYVCEHLKAEVKYLALAEAYYKEDDGHVQFFLNHAVAVNIGEINSVQSKLPPPPKSEIDFALNFLISGLTISFGSAGLEIVAAITESLVSGYESLHNESEDPARVAFSDLYDHVVREFEQLTTQRELMRDALHKNWGKLEAFGEAGLVWPEVTDHIRDAARKAFQIYMWKQLAKVVWPLQGDGALQITKNRPELITNARNYINYATSYGVSFLFCLIAPGEYEDCTHTAYSGYFVANCSVDRSDLEIEKILFEDLGVSRADFFLGRNGWDMPSQQVFIDPQVPKKK